LREVVGVMVCSNTTIACAIAALYFSTVGREDLALLLIWPVVLGIISAFYILLVSSRRKEVEG